MMRPYAELDIECFSNWFLIGFTDSVTGERWDFHQLADYPLDVAAVEQLCRHYTIRTFNGEHYDLLMLTAALQGMDNRQLKYINDKIIKGGKKSWENRKEFRLYAPDYIDHVDLMDVLPGVQIGLKVYAGRAHAPLMVETPVNFELPMPYDQIEAATGYCQNDRNATRLCASRVKPRIALRQKLTDKYGVDLRSKSDAQIAEHLVRHLWSEKVQAMIDEAVAVAGYCPTTRTWPDEGDNYYAALMPEYDVGYGGRPQPKRRWIKDGYSFRYEAPDYIQFVSPHLKDLLETCTTAEFVVRDKEQLVPEWIATDDDELVFEVPKIKTGVQMPPQLKQEVKIGGVAYQMGIGGLHSKEKNRSVYSTSEAKLRTIDVRSYYPSMMIQMGMYPEALGPIFLDLFESIYGERQEAKAAVKKYQKAIKAGEDVDGALAELVEELSTIEGGFKIVLNGTFGKLWSKYSIFFAPEMGVKITMTGQLGLLMLIEQLVLSGIQVVSANTDGLELLIPVGLEAVADMIVKRWEKRTGLVMEAEDYESLHSLNVNNYVAVYPGGKVKLKGSFRNGGVEENKNPNADICADAVVHALLAADRGAIDKFIRDCKDVRKFVVVRKVKGGGYWTGQEVEIEKLPTKIADWVALAADMGWTGYDRKTKILSFGDQKLSLDAFKRAMIEKDKEKEKVHFQPSEFIGQGVRWYYSTRGAPLYTKDGSKVASSDGAKPLMKMTGKLPEDIDYDAYIAKARKIYDQLNPEDIPF